MSDKRIDTYIEKAQPFAQPILKKLRVLIHKGCPEVVETIKWGMPFFEYKGPLCNIAAFKQHCVLGFWKGTLLKDLNNHLQSRAIDGGEAMGHFGKITSVKDLPSDKVILNFIKQAAKLNDDGIKVTKKMVKATTEIEIPEALQVALNKNKKAKLAFENFSASHKREYLEWITEAKTDVTRNKRIQSTIEWITDDKKRNWKYEKK